MKRFTFLFVFHSILFSTYGQQAVQLPEVIPPSPNAAALGKYVETPVSSSTGIPGIAVPVYEVKEGDISVPISLSYHAGGIKVEEIASWVGLGWALNAGGVISRSPRGLADDCYPYGYLHTSYTVEHFVGLQHSVYGENRYYQLAQASLGSRDYEPDMFTFNFGSYSGKFFYDQTTDKFIQTPFSNLKIEHFFDSSERIVQFKITTPDGFQYYFGKGTDNRIAVDSNSNTINSSYSSNTFGLSNSTPVCDYTSSWHLLEIVSPKNNRVKLFYQPRITNQFFKTGESFITENCDVRGYSANFSETLGNISDLQRIEFTGGKVEFVPGATDRLDFGGTKPLAQIKIYKGTSVFKTFNLTHEYFIAPAETGKWTSLGNATERKYRLKLISFQEINALGQPLPPHTFTYNGTALPSRFSNAQDYWGYYNGKTQNKDLIPEVRIPYTPALYIGDSDRTVDPVKSQAGMLKKITYPTGGSAEYFFESNTASDVISKGESSYNVRNRGTMMYFEFVKAPANYNSMTGMYSKNFTVGAERKGPIDVNTYVTGCDNSQTLSNFACDFLLEIRGVTDPGFSLNISSSSFSYEFPPGEYKITAMEAGLGQTAEPHFSCTMSWEEDLQPGYLVVGGQRIKKIVLSDTKGGTIEKNFEYNFFGQELTSGYTISSPVFVDSQYFNSTCNPPKDVYKITSNSQAPLAGVNGGTIGYQNVTEYQKGVIKTESTFSKVGDYAHFSAGSFGLVLLPDLYTDWLRGNLLKKNEFAFENDSYQLIRSTEFEMESYDRHSISNHGITVISTIGENNYTGKYGFYSGLSEWYRPKRTTVTNYLGSHNLVEQTTHYYNSNPLMPSRTEVNSSKNGLVAKDYFYPFDVNTSGQVGTANPVALSSTALIAVNNLKTKHQITVPVQVETNNGSGKTAVRNNFKLNGNIILPEIIQTSKSSEILGDRVKYSRYDSKGNPLEVSRSDGPSVAYIWGYNQQFPVGKVENATYAQIEALPNFGAGFNLNTGGLSTAQETSLRSGLPNAMVTTYSYIPLIGIESITDPKGNTMIYEYDEFNRLKFVKDQDGNILSENQYNYKLSSN